MRVIYYSYPFFADCDFPLVKALQKKGIEVFYYMPLHRSFQRSSILEFKRPIRRMGFVKASEVDEMRVYKDCLDLSRLYFIKGFPNNIFWIPSWILWVYVLWHMKQKKADIIHIDWQYKSHFEKFLFYFLLGKKKVMTVHDPIMHSGQPNAEIEEKLRIRSFRWADHFILLNKVQTEDFMSKYLITEDKISFSRLGNYDSIAKVVPKDMNIKGNYILFMGSIIPYKGLEYLLEAMVVVHKQCPDLRLVIAGGGNIYFDISKYEKMDYVEWIHRYVGVRELAGLLKKALFVVCPYKDATQSGVVQTAFAMGVPVVASNVGSLPSVITNNVNGILVPPCNAKVLADAIIALAGDMELLKSFEVNIQSKWKKDMGWNEVANDYIQVYKSLLE